MDRFRLTDPDAAEKARKLYWTAYGEAARADPMLGSEAVHDHALRAVLDAIEPEQPRLPTRSEVEARFRRVAVGGWPAGRDSEFMVTPRSVASVLIDTEWATEDPEPEVDPAQVDALAKLVGEASQVSNGMGRGYFHDLARHLLASGRVQVTP